jgi:hypothetical protein
MFPLKLLGSMLADHMLAWIQMPLIGTPAVGVKAVDAQRLEQGFQGQQCLILTTTEDIRQYPARLLIQHLPQPTRLLLAADKRPHFVQFGLLHLVNDHLRF